MRDLLADDDVSVAVVVVVVAAAVVVVAVVVVVVVGRLFVAEAIAEVDDVLWVEVEAHVDCRAGQPHGQKDTLHTPEPP